MDTMILPVSKCHSKTNKQTNKKHIKMKAFIILVNVIFFF